MEIELKSELAERAFQLDCNIKECRMNIRDNCLKIGLWASELKAGKLYKLLEPDAKNWEHFLQIRGWGIKRAQIDNYCQVAKLIGNDIADKDIPLNRAIDIARVISHIPKDEVEDTKAELIESAATLPKSGWDDTLVKMRGGVAKDECDHSETELWSKCCVKGGCGRFLHKV